MIQSLVEVGSPNYKIINGEEWSNSFLSKHLTIGGVKLANDSKASNNIDFGWDYGLGFSCLWNKWGHIGQL